MGDVQVACQQRAVTDGIQGSGLAGAKGIPRGSHDRGTDLVPELLVELYCHGSGVYLDHLLDGEWGGEVGASLQNPLGWRTDVVPEPETHCDLVGSHAERAGEGICHKQAEHGDLEDAETDLERLRERLLRRIELGRGNILRGQFRDSAWRKLHGILIEIRPGVDQRVCIHCINPPRGFDFGGWALVPVGHHRSARDFARQPHSRTVVPGLGLRPADLAAAVTAAAAGSRSG